MPRFVYDASMIARRHAELARIMPEKSTILYSVKANANPHVLAVLARLGLAAEVSSLGELRRATDAGFDVAQSVYGGPGKTLQHISVAIEMGVRQFSIESSHELDLFEKVRSTATVEASCVCRILHPSVGAGLNMMTPHSKFGMTLEEVGAFARRGGRVDGIHLYYGTQQTFADFVDGIAVTNKIVLEVEQIVGHELAHVNYGGGLAWPFMRHGEACVPQGAFLPVLPRERISFEFGRYLVASSGTLEINVLDAKMRMGRQVLIVDAGVHTIGGLAATGRVLRGGADFDCGTTDGALVDTAVYGPLCTPADYISLSVALPSLSIGATLEVPNCGAYGANTGLANFLMREPADEVVI